MKYPCHDFVYICGADSVWCFGPLCVEYHHYGGPIFSIGRHIFNPGRYSPWWLLWRVLRRRLTQSQPHGDRQ